MPSKFIVEPLDEEERELMESIENEEWISTLTPEIKSRMEEAARNTLNRLAQEGMVIQLSERDLQQIQSKAREHGLPNEALIHHIIHKYLSGELVEVVSH
ncbi:MAG: antitoxin [SAR324 cluster bacterium]|nr:antitoxin [SAR324 cluster bacterium]